MTGVDDHDDDDQWLCRKMIEVGEGLSAGNIMIATGSDGNETEF